MSWKQSRIDTGTIDKIDQTDWKDADGITDRAKLGTNSMLAERDYSIKCETGVHPIGVFKGFWMWWCFTHDQPQLRCSLGVSEDELKRMKSEVIDTIKGVKS